jgi:Protein of unknown function (DUF3185)
MGPKTIFGILILAGGIWLLNHGMNASHSYNDQTSTYVIGKFTYDTIWFMIGGAVASILGLILVLAGFRGKPI